MVELLLGPGLCMAWKASCSDSPRRGQQGKVCSRAGGWEGSEQTRDSLGAGRDENKTDIHRNSRRHKEVVF